MVGERAFFFIRLGLRCRLPFRANRGAVDVKRSLPFFPKPPVMSPRRPAASARNSPPNLHRRLDAYQSLSRFYLSLTLACTGPDHRFPIWCLTSPMPFFSTAPPLFFPLKFKSGASPRFLATPWSFCSFHSS